MADIRLELAEDENAEVEEEAVLPSQPSPSAFLLLGLRIEAMQ